MKFSFSSKFCQPLYQQLLQAVGEELDTHRLIYGINVREMMTAIHVSNPIIKRY